MPYFIFIYSFCQAFLKVFLADFELLLRSLQKETSFLSAENMERGFFCCSD